MIYLNQTKAHPHKALTNLNKLFHKNQSQYSYKYIPDAVSNNVIFNKNHIPHFTRRRPTH